MRIVDGYVMDHMDEVLGSLGHTEKIKTFLEGEIERLHSNFSLRCKHRDDDRCKVGADCDWTKCSRLHNSSKEDIFLQLEDIHSESKDDRQAKERLDSIGQAINDCKAGKLGPVAALIAIGMIAAPGEITEEQKEWAINAIKAFEARR